MDEFVVITEFNAKHIAQLLTLFKQNDWPNLESNLAILMKNSLSIALVNSKEDLIGYVRVLTDELKYAFIFDLVVDKAYRKNGLGTRLMEAVFAHPKLKTIKFFELTCAPETMPFYKKFQFSQIYQIYLSAF